jgi:CRP-like cAMP-binding protein
MGIGIVGFQVSSSGIGRDNTDGPLAPHSRALQQVGGNSTEPLRPPGASIGQTVSGIEERRRRVRARLAESDVFGALAEGDLDRLIGRGRTVTYASGVVVFRKGDPADHLMIVLQGRVSLSSAGSNGKQVLFDFIGPGRCFGEVALIEGTSRKLDATAVRPSTVFTLGRRDVLACLEAHPAIATRIIRVLCARLSRAMEMLEDRTQHGLRPGARACCFVWPANTVMGRASA